MLEVSLISGEVEDRITLHVWGFGVALAADPALVEGWENVQIHSAPVPDGTVMVEETNGFGLEWFARLPDGVPRRAVEFCNAARRVL